MIATYHNHTNWSDGKTDFAEIHAAAIAAGVDALGVSDHFCVFPDGSSRDWSMDPSRVCEYIEDIKSYQSDGRIEVRVGLEIDWFTDHESVIEPRIETLDLDYRIGSLHHVDEIPFDTCFSPDKEEDELLEVWKRYWKLEQNLAESGLFDTVAHIDIPKRLGYFPEQALDREISDALDAFAAHNVVVELNTAGYSMPCLEAYASPNILSKCKEREIPVTLSADGHEPGRILYEFERGLSQLHAAGYRELTRFRERETWFESIDEAYPEQAR